MTGNMEPLKVVSTSEQVASALRTAILLGELKGGDVINISETAERLGVSNTPVREALQKLSQEDWIILRRNRGAVVVGLSPKRVRDYYQVRGLLESEAARIAATRADVSELVQIFQEVEGQIQAGNMGNYNHCNKAIHESIWKLCGNDKMTSMMRSLWQSSSRAVHAGEEEYVRISHAEHRLIVEAIAGHDPDRAHEEMSKHLARSMQDVLTHFASE